MRPSDQIQPQDEALDRLARLAARVLDAPVAVLARGEGAELRIAAAHGLDPSAQEALQTVMRAAGCGADPEAEARRAGVTAWTAVPVGGGEGPAGVLLVADRRPRDWTAVELQHLADLG